MKFITILLTFFAVVCAVNKNEFLFCFSLAVFFVCSSKSSASPVLSNCEADVNDGGKEETCSTNDVRRMGKCEK